MVALAERALRCFHPSSGNTETKEAPKVDQECHVLCMGPSSPGWTQPKISQDDRQGYHEEVPCTKTLFVTPMEIRLLEQLLGALALSLWKVEITWQYQEDAGIIVFSGSHEAVLAAQVAVSQMLIRVSQAVRPGPIRPLAAELRVIGFYCLRQGLSLYLWHGDASGLSGDVIISISGKGGSNHGASVLSQRLLSQRGAPHTHVDVLLSHLGPGKLGTGALLLALQSASQQQHTSVVICVDPAGTWMAEAVAWVMTMFTSSHHVSSLSSISVVTRDGALAAALHAAWRRYWPTGGSQQELLGKVLQAQESVSVEVVTGSMANQKTDVVVLPLAPGLHGPCWCRGAQDLAEAALAAAPHLREASPGEVRTVLADAVPDLNCKMLYVVRLDEEQLWHQGAHQVIRQIVQSCLGSLYGSFLQSISFPLIQPDSGAGMEEQEAVCVMLDEINRFLKHKPNTWMKLVQIVCPPGLSPPGLVAEYIKTPTEAVGFCQLEDPLFLRYLDESPATLHKFEGHLKAAGYSFQAYASQGILLFQARAKSSDLHSWEPAFRSMREKFTVRRGLQMDLLGVLSDEPSLVEKFESIRVYDGMCFVGLVCEMARFLQSLQVKAFQKQVVCRQYPAEPMHRYVIVKDMVDKEMQLSKHHVSIDLRQGSPATITLQGPCGQVTEVERRLEQLLGDFRVVPVPLSPLQAWFVHELRSEVFSETFFLEREIPVLLCVTVSSDLQETSTGVLVSGLDWNKLQEAAKLLMSLVCQQTLLIEEGLRWATECQEWTELLARLGAKKDVAFHFDRPSQGVLTMVGLHPHVEEAEAAVREYLSNNSLVQERLAVLRPELVEVGEELLRIMDWENPQVKVQVCSSPGALSLELEGLRKDVQEARKAVRADLLSLVLGIVAVRDRALEEYLTSAGESLLQGLAQQLRCVVSLRGRTWSTDWERGQGLVSEKTDALRKLPKGKKGALSPFAEASERLVIRIVGREDKVACVKTALSSFMTQFHEESICNTEIVAFSDQTLKDLSRRSFYRFPLALHRIQGNVLCVRGCREDVDKAVAAVYAKIQAAQAKQVDTQILYGLVKWYHMSHGEWFPFDIAISHQLESEYGKKQRKTVIIWEGQRTEVDLLKQEGFVPGRGTTISIRREICLQDKVIAPHWEPMGEGLVKMVELQPSSEEYQEVAKGFNRTAEGFSILKIERVQNKFLWVSYCWKRSWMVTKNPPGVRNERILYHGTQPENCCSIQEIGFKSTCRKVGLYGQGLYFGVDASLSVFYAKPDSSGHRFVFQARVLTGQFTRGEEKMALPPQKPDGSGRYDSVANLASRPTVFVTFFDDHAYPEYLITFHGTRVQY
ncbi:uncharacterized protein LOC102561087 [Alligator mississippiensis]|nr:uncharacterized protein LOC102561087 [Alligator mississippiensis]